MTALVGPVLEKYRECSGSHLGRTIIGEWVLKDWHRQFWDATNATPGPISKNEASNDINSLGPLRQIKWTPSPRNPRHHAKVTTNPPIRSVLPIEPSEAGA
jgi:hypothetical protein